MVGRPRNTPSESGGSPEASGNSHTARSNSSAQEAVNKTWLSMTAVQSRLLLLQLEGMLAATTAIFTWYDKVFVTFYRAHP
jgi:hypothetical protein